MIIQPIGQAALLSRSYYRSGFCIIPLLNHWPQCVVALQYDNVLAKVDYWDP